MTREKHTFYQITVNGALDPDWSDWLNGFDVHTEVGPNRTCSTRLTGPIMDQAELRGLLNKILDLNLELVALVQINEPSDPDLSNSPIP